jgi:hypothetical protein
MAEKIKITGKQTFDILFPYAKNRIMDQIRALALIIVYLILFQTVVLGLPLGNALSISIGLGLVIFGLAFFMEGLILGLMPLGEQCGVKLPLKLKLPFLLLFALILGFGATLAEPAIGVLKAAGFSVKVWNAPLLFLLLNKYSIYLVYAVGLGVGLAVIFGMLRFLYNWSLKPFILIIVPILIGISIWAYFDPNLVFLTGVAWDCGGITTGPVTVPLVLALGIGVSRIVGGGNSGVSSGFGVVTLASAFPVLTVMLLGVMFMGQVPAPMKAAEFFASENKAKALSLFKNEADMTGYVLKNAGEDVQAVLFNSDRNALNAYLNRLVREPEERTKIFGTDAAFYDWVLKKASDGQKKFLLKENPDLTTSLSRHLLSPPVRMDIRDVFKRNGMAAVQAILPLSIFLLIVFFTIIREKLPRADEVFLGIGFALIGMTLFNIGIELGLARVGNEVGGKLTSSFRAIALPENQTLIRNFDPSIVQKAIDINGNSGEFFYAKDKNEFRTLPFDPNNYDPALKQYIYTPTKGPIFGKENSIAGIIVVLLFGFLLGYGATLAEPALNALGMTVEELSVGTFKKSFLIQAVAIGVGAGIAWGVAKIIWDLPLIWLLIPPYALCLILTILSTEDFTNIGWDSAGVTTGPITVPLVLAMGLGISTQVGVIEGFGVLALASVYPILSVLITGLVVTMARKKAMREVAQDAG